MNENDYEEMHREAKRLIDKCFIHGWPTTSAGDDVRLINMVVGLLVEIRDRDISLRALVT